MPIGQRRSGRFAVALQAVLKSEYARAVHRFSANQRLSSAHAGRRFCAANMFSRTVPNWAGYPQRLRGICGALSSLLSRGRGGDIGDQRLEDGLQAVGCQQHGQCRHHGDVEQARARGEPDGGRAYRIPRLPSEAREFVSCLAKTPSRRAGSDIGWCVAAPITRPAFISLNACRS